MKPCRAYLDAPNPTPKPVVQALWALSNQKGEFRRYFDGSVVMYTERPGGSLIDEHVWKPRRVRVAIEPVKRKAGKA